MQYLTSERVFLSCVVNIVGYCYSNKANRKVASRVSFPIYTFGVVYIKKKSVCLRPHDRSENFYDARY
jgi:hypothetical protein